MADWPSLAALFDDLDQRSLADRAMLVRWLEDWDELTAAVDEEGTRRNIEMTLHTDDPAKEKAHMFFVEEIEPKLRPRQEALKRRFLAAPARSALGPAYAVLDRSLAVESEIYRDANVPLFTEEEKLSTEYQKTMGAMTVPWDGEERTLARLRPVLEETDRARREAAWTLSARRRLADKDKLEGLFEQLLILRGRIAAQADLPDYRAFMFKTYKRFDYTPAHCEAFHAAVERCVVPLVRQLQADRRRDLKLASLRPWDLAVDPTGQPPLKPFGAVKELIDGTGRMIRRVDPELAGQFERMRALDLLNLENYKGKAPGGYQATLAERRLPFIFMNAVGMDEDVRTLAHEGGHAFHTFAARDLPVQSYRHAPMEFCEVASMGMELLVLPHLDEFYKDPGALARARRSRLEDIVEILPWIATIDAFQHWLYTHPGHTAAARREAWLGVHRRFSGGEDWSGFEEERAYLWHRQLHLFEVPFYYIEYGIAQLGALGLWVQARRDPNAALANYRKALALGGSRPLPDLFAAAGLPFDFSEQTVTPLIETVRTVLAASLAL